VSKYIHPITLEAAIEVASNLRPEDRREVEEGHGIDLIDYADYVSQIPSYVYFTVPNGRTAGMAGVSSDGAIWMLCTPAINDYPITFAREAKRYVEGRSERLLWNVVDKRNTVHLKLLKFLGFKFLRELLFGPNNLPFIEFCYVCRSK
jgi:hypothetical protein|tara:strand:+ start:2747 stop:3190 length:444 start_codon:yes stop_codon:yes gene_type:complete